MLHRPDSEPGARIPRIGWAACIAVPLLVLAILWATASARALGDDESEATADPSNATVVEFEESEETCFENEAGLVESQEECESEEECAGEAECFLRTARARIVAYPSHNRIRLTLGYTTYAPTRATVEYRVRNGERLGSASRHLSRSGVLRLSKRLGNGEMARASASHRFVVTLRLPDAARGCQSYEAPAAVLFK